MRVGGPKFLRAVGRNSGGSTTVAATRSSPPCQRRGAAPHRPALPQSAGGARVVPLRGLASRGWRWCSTTSTNSTRGQQTTTCVPGRVSRCRHCEEWECERANAQKRKLGLEALIRDIKHHDDAVSGVRIDDHPFPAHVPCGASQRAPHTPHTNTRSKSLALYSLERVLRSVI